MKILKHLRVPLWFYLPILFMLSGCGPDSCKSSTKQPIDFNLQVPFSNIGVKAIVASSDSLKLMDPLIFNANLDSALTSKNFDPSKLTISKVTLSSAELRITSPSTGNFNSINLAIMYLSQNSYTTLAALLNNNANSAYSFTYIPQNVNILNTQNCQVRCGQQPAQASNPDLSSLNLYPYMNKKMYISWFVDPRSDIPKCTVSLSLTLRVQGETD